MQRVKVTLAYVGTHYFGWQVQSGKPAIQPLVQKALEVTLRHPILLTGSGRTDRGVHARGQVAHFDTEVNVALDKLLISLNALLPADIRVQKMEFVPADFHARYSAKSKIYHYHLYLAPVLDPFSRNFCHHVKMAFDLDKLKQGAALLLGEHDFAAFSNKNTKGCAAYDSIRVLQRIDVVEEKNGIRLEFEADGFLYKMVRNMTGTLLEIARGYIPPDKVIKILEGKNRSLAGETAPAKGLFLHEVIYTVVEEKRSL